MGLDRLWGDMAAKEAALGSPDVVQFCVDSTSWRPSCDVRRSCFYQAPSARLQSLLWPSSAPGTLTVPAKLEQGV